MLVSGERSHTSPPTLSRTPEENVRMLLEGLPNDTFTFDVITHSRGGLTLNDAANQVATALRSVSGAQDVKVEQVAGGGTQQRSGMGQRFLQAIAIAFAYPSGR